MSTTETLDPTLSPAEQRRGAAIFLSSQDFYSQHQEVLPLGFGVVSSVNRIDETGKQFRESLGFDARGREDGKFVWEIVYGAGGAQKVTRLLVSADSFDGMYIETSTQGSVTKAFDMQPEELVQAETRLLERLASPEVQDCISEASDRRRRLEQVLANLALEKDKEEANWGSPSRGSEQAIAVQTKQLARTGFVPMVIFDLARVRYRA